MSATMRILGWEAQGLRCPDHKISCTDENDRPFPVSLIQMPNGTGKTTTLNLLRATLSGAGSNWNSAKIAEFRKRNSAETQGFFEVALLLNERRTTIRMEFDFDDKEVAYKTTSGPGLTDGFKPPSDFSLFMDENFVNFYVFDGELAQHLLDSEYTDAEKVVESLFQMDIFAQMMGKIEEHWEAETKKQSTSAKENKGLVRQRNLLKRLYRRLTSLQQQQKEAQARHASLEEQLNKKKEDYEQRIKQADEFSTELKVAEDKVQYLTNEVNKEAQEVLDRMRNPYALSESFATSMLTFKDGLDKVKLPEKAAREFFEDLANESTCVCGRPIDKEIAATIRERSGQYLGDDYITLLNSMKTAIKEGIGASPGYSETDLNGRIADLAAKDSEEREAKNDLDALKKKAEIADPEGARCKDRH